MPHPQQAADTWDLVLWLQVPRCCLGGICSCEWDPPVAHTHQMRAMLTTKIAACTLALHPTLQQLFGSHCFASVDEVHTGLACVCNSTAAAQTPCAVAAAVGYDFDADHIHVPIWSCERDHRCCT